LFVGVFTLAYAVTWPPSIKAEDQAFVVAASKIIWGKGVDLRGIGCLTLNRKGNHIFKTDYSNDPQILGVLRKYFSGREISLNDPSCDYVLTFNIIVTDTRAVKYAGQISRMLMSFSVIERNPVTGALEYDGRHFKGSYKNLYLFRPDLRPLEAFKVGLKAFVTSQKERWALMRILISGDDVIE
jgi:hypothetical protein